MYDITDRNSFVRVQNWVKELRKMLGKDIELAIVGNKIDLEANRVVTVDEAEKYDTNDSARRQINDDTKARILLHRYAASVGAKHYHTSAKLDKGIAELFLDLTKRTYPLAGNIPRLIGFVTDRHCGARVKCH